MKVTFYRVKASGEDGVVGTMELDDSGKVTADPPELAEKVGPVEVYGRTLRPKDGERYLRAVALKHRNAYLRAEMDA